MTLSGMSLTFWLLSMKLELLNMLLLNNKDAAIEHEFDEYDDAEDETQDDEATIIESAVPTVVVIKDI